MDSLYLEKLDDQSVQIVRGHLPIFLHGAESTCQIEEEKKKTITCSACLEIAVCVHIARNTLENKYGEISLSTTTCSIVVDKSGHLTSSLLLPCLCM